MHVHTKPFIQVFGNLPLCAAAWVGEGVWARTGVRVCVCVCMEGLISHRGSIQSSAVLSHGIPSVASQTKMRICLALLDLTQFSCVFKAITYSYDLFLWDIFVISFLVGRMTAWSPEKARVRHGFWMVNSHPPFLFPALLLIFIPLLLYSASHCGFSQSLLPSSPFTASLLHPLPLAHYIPTRSPAGRVFNMLLLIHSADYSNTAQQRKRGGLRSDFRPCFAGHIHLAHSFTLPCLEQGFISSQSSSGFGVQ